MAEPVPFTRAEPTEPDLFATFKDSQGRFRTKSLFMEHLLPAYPAHFTLKKFNVTKNGKEYISMYKKYIEIGDPTEYQVATRLLGSWDHWLVLQKAQWFREELAGWRSELQIKMESERAKKMLEIVNGGDPSSAAVIQATKWLADRYGTKKDIKRGRPSKDEVDNHLKRLKAEDEDLSEDLARLGLTK